MQIRSDYGKEVFALFGGEDQCWDPVGGMLFSDINIECGNLGVVLRVERMEVNGYADKFVKILTERGVGWIYEFYLECIQCKGKDHGGIIGT